MFVISKKYQIVPRSEWGLSNIEKWNNKMLYHNEYKNHDSGRNIFLHFKIFFANDKFGRMTFFPFSFLFGCLKLEFLVDFFEITLKLVYIKSAAKGS